MASLTVSTIVCAYTEKRWGEFSAGVAELLQQAQQGDEVIAVIDHNDQLLQRAQEHFSGTELIIVANAQQQGLSGARNTGVQTATGDIVCFLDDDAFPGPGWIDAYRKRFESDDSIVGVGGAVSPDWEGDHPPKWFPEEFGWVVGCDYRGLPGNGEQIRNPIGASMGLRRAAVAEVGGFSTRIGRVGEVPIGNEETEMGIRLRQADPSAQIVRDTTSVVHHLVPVNRQTVKYFMSRCYHEGISKSAMTTEVGAADGLSSERTYVVKTLLGGMGKHTKEAFHGDPSGLARAAMLPMGLAATTFGYARGLVKAKRENRAAARTGR